MAVVPVGVENVEKTDIELKIFGFGKVFQETIYLSCRNIHLLCNPSDRNIFHLCILHEVHIQHTYPLQVKSNFGINLKNQSRVIINGNGALPYIDIDSCR